MKRKFSKILGIGLALSLLASLLLVAAPVLADVSQPEVDVDEDTISAESEYTITFDVNDELETNYTLYKDGLGTATWVDKDGARSVKLDRGSGTGSVYVEIAPQSGITFAEFAGALSNYSFEHWIDTVTANGPQFELHFEDPDSDGWLEVTAVGLQGYTGTGAWVTETLSSTTPAGYGGWGEAGSGAGFFNWGPLTDLGDIETAVNGETNVTDAGDWELTRVRVETWEASAPDCYIDDVIIDGDEAEALTTITIEFPDDTEFAEAADWTNADVTVQTTAGFGEANDETDVGGHVVIDDDDLTVTIGLAQLENNIGEGATVRVEFAEDPITNPSEPGTYTLRVQTSEEDDWVESAEYDIDAPDVGGSVYVYNASDVLLATYGGADAIDDAEEDDYFAEDDYTIEVGPGSYDLDGDVTITGEGLTLVSEEGAEETIIDGGSQDFGIIIEGDEVTVEGFTIDDADIAVTIDASEVVLTNCVITDADIGVQIDCVGVEDVADIEVTDNVIEDCADGIVFVVDGGDLSDCDITGNEITGADNDGAIVFLGGNDDIDIKDNTITGNEVAGIYFDNDDAACNNIDIKGNTISENEEDGIWIDTDTAPTDLVITGNTIADNEEAGLNVDSWTDADCVFMFNDIYDNDDNVDAEEDITNAIFNWWGTDDEDDIEDTITGNGDVEFEPWLTGLSGSVSAGSEIEVGDGGLDGGEPIDPVTSLDGKDDASVNVTGIEDDEGAGADIICAFKYAANPADAIDDAIGFYDVFMIINDDVAPGDVSGKLKFYDSAITEGAVASFWTGDFWNECSDQLARDGVVYVDLTEDTVPSFDEMGETPFVVVAGEPEEGLAEPVVIAPESGAEDISLRPSFAWGVVEDVDGYCFELADNAGFILPLVSFNDEKGLLAAPAYAYRTALDYDSAYYWRVRGVSGSATTKKGITTFEEQSDWVTGVFATKAEPEPEEPAVEIVEAPELPDITIEPIVEVITPPATPVTPSWIYVIIAVGAVLVIALLVLIVRTRRVA